MEDLGKREENHLKPLLAQGSPKESWEVCKVHAGIMVRGLRTKSSCSPSACTPPFSALPPSAPQTHRSNEPLNGGRSPQHSGHNHRKREGRRVHGSGERLRKQPPDSRSRSGVLRPLRPSRIPGVQSPPGLTSQLHGGAGKGPRLGE